MANKWFSDFRFILHKDIMSTRRVKKYLVTSIIPPLVLLTLFSLLYSTGQPETYKVVLVDLDNTDYSNEMTQYITDIHSEFGAWFSVVKVDSQDEALRLVNDYEILGAIIIPQGFGTNITSGGVGMLKMIVQNINWDYPKNFMQRLDEAVLQFNEDHHLGDDPVDNFKIKVEKEYLIGDTGNDVSMFRGLIVGIVGLYGITFGLLMGALNIAKEFEDETITEITNSPVSKTAYIASKQTIGVVFGLTFTLIFGTILYLLTGVNYRGGIAGIIIIILSYCISTWIHANLGALLGLKFKKIMPTIILSIMMAMILWFFCGGLGPAVMMGELVYNISRWLPGSYWNEILFAATYFPVAGYLVPRILTLIIYGIITTTLSWVILAKRGFESE